MHPVGLLFITSRLLAKSASAISILMDKVAIYIHIPFCLKKCSYCSFVSYGGRRDFIPRYIQALKKEISTRVVDNPVATIYFGGGTPSLLTVGQIRELLDWLKANFTFDNKIEVSLEANPGTLNKDFLSELREMGINRLSLGAQSFHNDELKMLGRVHCAEDIEAAFHLARNAGFTNINLDLIYGIPGQSLMKWEETLKSAVRLGPEHLSCYLLTLEDDVPLTQSISDGTLPLPDDDVACEQYKLAEAVLSEYDYEHYELSNWAKPGFRCQHNLFYWQLAPYLGFGVAAHSFINGHRRANTGKLDTYLDNPFSIEEDNELDKTHEVAEATILGLRLTEGIDLKEMDCRFGDMFSKYKPVFEDTMGLGLLEIAGNRIRLTDQGRFLSNEVFWRLLPDS